MSNLHLAWKTVCPGIFHCIGYVFFIIQDFWATSVCPEKQSCPGIFHCIEIFFIIQDFWATSASPENRVCPEYFQPRRGGRLPRPPASYAYASVYLSTCNHQPKAKLAVTLFAAVFWRTRSPSQVLMTNVSLGLTKYKLYLMETGQADMENRQGDRGTDRGGDRVTGEATGEATRRQWRRRGDRGGDRATGEATRWQGRPGKVGQNEQMSSTCLFCLIGQKHCWSYFDFSQTQSVEGKIAPAMLLPHDAKYTLFFLAFPMLLNL